MSLQVRVVEGRHLFNSTGAGAGIDSADIDASGQSPGTSSRPPPQMLNASVRVVVSLNDKNLMTEASHDLIRPLWTKVCKFSLDDAVPSISGEEVGLEMRPMDSSTHSEPTYGRSHRSANPSGLEVRPGKMMDGEGDLLVPPAPTRHGRHAASTSSLLSGDDATMLVLHLRVFSESLVSKDLLGDISLDLGELLLSDGETLVPDCIGQSYRQSEGWGKKIAVDTWVALRQGAGELRLQMLVGPDSEVSPRRDRAPTDGWQGSQRQRQRVSSDSPERSRPEPLFPEQSPEVVAVQPPGGQQRSQARGWVLKGDYKRQRPQAWDKLEKEREAGRVKVSRPPWQQPLEEMVAAVEEEYGDSYSMREGVGLESLMRYLQYFVWREQSQQEAWARQLAVGSELRDAVERSDPPRHATLFRLRSASSKDGVRVYSRHAMVRPSETSLFDLVSGGIPDSLHSGGDSDEELEEEGLAYAGGPGELAGVGTSVPGVEVVRISGHMCCAEYKIHVRRAGGQEWSLFRRYSDFLDLYDQLPSAFTAGTVPLPPKSWRSLSHLTMTPEFLEDRRVGLEAALRRLLIEAAAAEGAGIEQVVRSFLGLPRPQKYGLGQESVGLALLSTRLPRLILRGMNSLCLVKDLRVGVWMLLSGAAALANEARTRMLYSYVSACRDEKDWEALGGKASEWQAALPCFEAIDVDVNRTYVKSDEEREAVRQVLRSLALCRPAVGYCQAMNFVSLFLVRTTGGRCDLAYWIISAMALEVVPGYWESSACMYKVQRDLALLRGLAQERLPALLSHLDSIGLPLELLVCDWMLSLFCRLLPPLTVLRVWDWLFYEGSDIIIFVTLAVLRVAEQEMLQEEGMCASADRLNAISGALDDADELIMMAVAEKHAVLDRAGAADLQELRLAQLDLDRAKKKRGVIPEQEGSSR
ncbi:unnamed protein product [Chrysoparadoxa australica]